MEAKTENITQQLFKAIDNRDTEVFLTFLADDVSFRFGNVDAVGGKSAVAEAVGGFFSSIKALHHKLTECWDVDGAVICHGNVTYTRHDSTTLSVPFANILAMEGDLVKDYIIFADVSELYIIA